MLFEIVRILADNFSQRSDKSMTMLIAMIVLAVFLLGTAWFALRKRRKWMAAAWVVLLLVLLPQIFAFSTFLEWSDQIIAPEYVGELQADQASFANYIVEGKNGFTLTGTPPDGTCGWGDIPLEKLPAELSAKLITDYQIDCDNYTYLFTRGIRNPQLEYSVWSNGHWYLGPKGFWRSNDDAKLVSADDPSQEDTAIYIFRFPRKYIALRNDPIDTGSVSYFFIKLSW